MYKARHGWIKSDATTKNHDQYCCSRKYSHVHKKIHKKQEESILQLHNSVTYWRSFLACFYLCFGAVQKLCGQDFDHFWLPIYLDRTFLTLNVDKKKHFLTTYPPHLVHVVLNDPFHEKNATSDMISTLCQLSFAKVLAFVFILTSLKLETWAVQNENTSI